ncbi:MAG: hypothetical protein ACK56F_26235, partial [bacterium]
QVAQHVLGRHPASGTRRAVARGERVDLALGDEGELFAQRVLGNTLSSEQLAAIQADVDSTTLTIDGVQVAVELDAFTGITTFNLSADTGTSGDRITETASQTFSGSFTASTSN